MTESVFVGGGCEAVVTTASTTWFGGLHSDNAGPRLGLTTESPTAVTVRAAGTVQNWIVNATTNSRASSATVFKARKNSADAGPTVSCTASTTGLFSDVVNTCAYADGDTWGVALATGAGSGSFGCTYGAEFVTSGQASLTLSGFGNTNAFSSTYYFSLGGYQNGSNTTENNVKSTCPEAGTVSNCQIILSTNGKSGTSTYRSRKNGANGNQTISISGGATGIFEDTTHSDSVAAGDTFGFSLQSADASGALSRGLGAKWVGSTAGAIMAPGGTGFTTMTSGQTKYGGPFQAAVQDVTEARVKTPAPFTGTLDKVYVYIASNASSAAVTVVSRKNTADGNISVSVTGSTTGAFSDLTHSDSYVRTDLLDFKASGPNGNIVFASICSRMTGPVAVVSAPSFTRTSKLTYLTM